jgi:uncharacterized coiled-coil DUF342 family protein
MAHTKSTTSPSNEPSLLVKAVQALDSYFSELERLANKIGTMELKTEFDFEQARKLLSRYGECGDGVSNEVLNLSNYLNEARVRSDEMSKAVMSRAEEINSHQTESQKKIEEFRQLGEKVRALTDTISDLRPADDANLSVEERGRLSEKLFNTTKQLDPLIEEAQNLRFHAHQAKMRALEKNADALTQTLQAARQRLSMFKPGADSQI